MQHPAANAIRDEVLEVCSERKTRLFRVRDYTGRNGQVKPAHYFLKAWNRAAKHVGPYSFHCLRVYANSEMTRAGVDIIDRERILGHKSGRVQAAYTPADLQRVLKAVNSIR